MNSSNSELVERLSKILDEMSEIMKSIGPKLIRAAHLKSESVVITEELRKRGLVNDADQS